MKLESNLPLAGGDAINLWGCKDGKMGLWPQAPWKSPLWDDLLHQDEHKTQLDGNTLRFRRTGFGNNVLLSGARGTGKSSLIKALVLRHASAELRFIQADRDGLQELPRLLDYLAGRSGRYILCCDDLSFEPNETDYKVLKSILEGAWGGVPENVKVYATANRRHLLPEYMKENTESEEIHPGETQEEKISLSERFGLWLSFYSFDQEEYLDIVEHWLKRWGVPQDKARASHPDALRWALTRGGRSGRIAYQFAQDFAGRYLIGEMGEK